MHDLITFLYSKNWHNIVNQLNFNLKKEYKLKWNKPTTKDYILEFSYGVVGWGSGIVIAVTWWGLDP